jgi:2-polyprenyl-3-methyl-5-hydroxy-6-metoxy-1,4-benzoquinol methylase
MKRGKAKESQNQVQLDEYFKKGAINLGPWTSYIVRHDPKRLEFLLARYRFCAKTLAHRELLEVGCGDAFGTLAMLEWVVSVHGIDFEPIIIEDANARLKAEGVKQIKLSVHDITKEPMDRLYDGAYALDVIEHIPPESEKHFMENICKSLRPHATCILGTPNIDAQKYANPISARGHVNLMGAGGLSALLSLYFHSVIIFSMNDSVVHSGFFSMAHYLLGVGVGVK